MTILDTHSYLLGKICKITLFGVELARQYEMEFGIGNYQLIYHLYEYCHAKSKYEVALMFINEPPIYSNGLTLYCLKEIGKYSTGDYYWLTLDQLVICS